MRRVRQSGVNRKYGFEPFFFNYFVCLFVCLFLVCLFVCFFGVVHRLDFWENIIQIDQLVSSEYRLFSPNHIGSI